MCGNHDKKRICERHAENDGQWYVIPFPIIIDRNIPYRASNMLLNTVTLHIFDGRKRTSTRIDVSQDGEKKARDDDMIFRVKSMVYFTSLLSLHYINNTLTKKSNRKDILSLI